MDSRHLKPEQAAKLVDQLGRMARWHNRLIARMSAQGFPTDDGLWIAALRAQQAVQDLYGAALRIDVKTGVGVKAD